MAKQYKWQQTHIITGQNNQSISKQSTILHLLKYYGAIPAE